MRNDISKVVVGVDGSPASLRALWHAVQEARTRLWPLQIVNVADEIGFSAAAASTAVPGAAAYLNTVDSERGLRIVFDALVELFGGRPEDIPIRVMVASPPIGEALVNALKGTDLLVVGRTRRGPLRRFWLGSVSGYCVAHAPCPVVIVPAPEAPRRSYTVRQDRRGARRAASDR